MLWMVLLILCMWRLFVELMILGGDLEIMMILFFFLVRLFCSR